MTKNFTITGAIFNEVECFELNSDNYDEYYDVLQGLAQKELGLDEEEFDNEDEYNEAVDNELNNIICVNRISMDGLLYRALLKWHNRKEENVLSGYSLNVLENVRSAVYEGEYLYYVTGYGYDTISSDLLGGSADGQAKREFLDWINE